MNCKASTGTCQELGTCKDACMAEVKSTWCEIHQHHKACEHNGGKMGLTGWEWPKSSNSSQEGISQWEQIYGKQNPKWEAYNEARLAATQS